MPPSTALTAGQVRKTLNWLIKCLKQLQRQMCRQKVLAARARESRAVAPIIWSVDCAPPAKGATEGSIHWTVDCAPPDKPVDVCEALAACIAVLEQLRDALAPLPAKRLLTKDPRG